MSNPPPALRRMVRDLVYPSPADMRALAARMMDQNEYSAVDAHGLLLMGLHAACGSQMLVAADVVADLLASDIASPDFERVPWPAPVLEMVFSETSLPSILVGRVSRDVLLAHGLGGLASSTSDDDPPVLLMAQGSDEGGPCVFLARHSSSEMNAYASGLLHGATIGDGVTCDEGLEADESEAMRFLALLAYKVLMFCAVPNLRPQPNKTWTRRSGGKPGFRGRPRRPSLRVCYLPSVKDALLRSRRENGAGSRRRTFRGRRGHLHWYRHDRFVRRCGTFDFFPPVPGPDGSVPRRRFVVRRPSKTG